MSAVIQHSAFTQNFHIKYNLSSMYCIWNITKYKGVQFNRLKSSLNHKSLINFSLRLISVLSIFPAGIYLFFIFFYFSDVIKEHLCFTWFIYHL